MGVYSGPDTVIDGLVFAYDMGNPDKSWKGPPTTNLAKNASNVVDWSVSNLLQSVTRTTIVTNEVYRITSTSGTGTSFRIYFISAVLVNGATYTVSYKYKIISGGPLFRANDWCDESITRVTTALPNGVFYETATGTRSTYDSTYRFLDFEMSNNTVVEIYDLQLEQRSFATPYSSTQIRPNTQALLDLTNLNTITATSLTYASNGTFSFNGTNDNISVTGNTNTRLANPVQTISAMCYITSVGPNVYAELYIAYNNSYHVIKWEPTAITLGLGSDFYTNTIAMTNAYNTWMEITCIINWSTLQFQVYKNGAFVNSRAITIGTHVYTNPNLVSIGGNSATGNGGDYLKGRISSVKVYNRALTAAEIQQNFNAIRGRYGI